MQWAGMWENGKSLAQIIVCGQDLEIYHHQDRHSTCQGPLTEQSLKNLIQQIDFKVQSTYFWIVMSFHKCLPDFACQCSIFWVLIQCLLICYYGFFGLIFTDRKAGSDQPARLGPTDGNISFTWFFHLGYLVRLIKHIFKCGNLNNFREMIVTRTGISNQYNPSPPPINCSLVFVNNVRTKRWLLDSSFLAAFIKAR